MFRGTISSIPFYCREASSGPAMAIPATSVIKRSSGGRRGARLITSGTARRSRTSRRTERRSRSTGQRWPLWLSTRMEPPADIAYGDLRATLEKSGRLIGPNDLLIAAQSLALEMVLVTDNEREFERVDGLKVENWLR